VLASSQPGKSGQSGVSVKGAFFIENQTLMVGLEIKNNTQ
jgi:hypothetical protein